MIRRNNSTFLAAVCLAVLLNIVWNGIDSRLFAFPSALSSTFSTVVLSENVAKVQQVASSPSVSKINQVAASPTGLNFSMSDLASQPALAFGGLLAVLAVVATIGATMGGQQPQESHASKEKPKKAAPATVAAATPAKPSRAAPAKSAPASSSAFSDGQRVIVLDPPALKGRLGMVVGPSPSQGAVTVCFDGDSTKYLIFAENLKASSESPATSEVVQKQTPVAPAAPAAPASPASPAAPAEPATPATQRPKGEPEDELEFTEGQRVMILGPPAMKGTQGNVVAPIKNKDAFAVRLDSGSIFNILTENLQDAASPGAASPAEAAVASVAAPSTASAPAPETSQMQEQKEESGEDEDEFTEGQRVSILGPPAMQGKQGNIVAPVKNKDAFAVRLDSGSVFNILTENLQDASAPGAAPVAASVSTPVLEMPPPPPRTEATQKATDEAGDEIEFTEGQRVVVLGPPAMKGKQGNIVAPVKNKDAFSVRLDSGSVFDILTENLEGK